MAYYVPILSPIARMIKRKWLPLKFRGSGVSCPVCQAEFTAFVGGPLGSCPGCDSAPRGRLLWLYWKNKWPRIFDEPLSVLQFAPARSLEKALRRQPKLKYLSADLFEPDAMISLDITEIALPDRCFDVVLCSHILELVPNDRKAIREIFRILHPGGTAFIQIPQDEGREITYEDPTVIGAAERDRAFGAFDHVRIYGRDFLPRLQQAGFDVSIVKHAEDLDAATLRQFGLWNDSIYVCRRPDA
jgi:SAM-dependent methyltransferase